MQRCDFDSFFDSFIFELFLNRVKLLLFFF